MSDFGAFEGRFVTKESSEQGSWMIVKDGNDKPVYMLTAEGVQDRERPFSILVRGPESEASIEFNAKDNEEANRSLMTTMVEMQGRPNKAKRVPVLTNDEELVRASALTMTWKNYPDKTGKTEIAFEKGLMAALYLKIASIRRQVIAYNREDANFIQPSSPGSSTS